MKTILKFSISMLIMLNAAVAQESGSTTIWATVSNNSILPEDYKGNLVSSSPELQNIIEEFEIVACQQALPSSRKENLLRVYEFELLGNQEACLTALNSVPGIKRPELGPVYQTLYEPDDYYISFTEDYALDVIGAQEAWEHTMGDTSIHIGITDTNYDLTHSELSGTVSYVQAGISHPNYYHGTAVATTAAGNTDNGIGKSSIGANSQLQLYAMNYNNILSASYNGCQIINVSWTSGCYYGSYYQGVIDEAYENGSIVVAAAGNGSTCGGPDNYVYPASLNHVISVSSVGPAVNHERYPGDPSSTFQHNDSVDYCAPGYDVALTVSEGWYLTGNGSSFSAPMVSGTIALMLAVNPCLTFEQVEFILDSTSVNLDPFNPDYAGLLGAGQIHATKAVELAMSFISLNLELESILGCTPTTGKAYLELPSASSPYSILWSNGSTIEIQENLTEGWYYVEVLSDEGCFGYDSVYVETQEEIVLNGDIISIQCNGDANGAIEVTTTGGSAPYYYSWDTGDSSSYLTDLVAGDYSLEVVDSLGCVQEIEFNLTEPDLLEVNADIYNNYDEFDNNEINLTVIGGTAPYNYNWDSGETTEDLTHLPNGIYTVEISDTNGCSLIASYATIGATLNLTSNEQKIEIYPNPSNGDNVNISWDGIEVKSIQLYSASGQMVFENIINDQFQTFQISDLESGVYILHIIDVNNEIRPEKIVVNN